MSDTIAHDDPAELENRWRPVIEKLDPFRADDTDDVTERRSILTMFPYPSGDLHMGHGEVYAITDVLARYWFQRGYNVLHPIGWDAFGLPAENAAIRRGQHPAEWTYANIATQAESLHRYAGAFDWSRRFDTCEPSYYHWNQWLFLRMYEQGLAYRRKAPVNWCPSCATVLANEQVVGGACERCDTAVVQRELTQWFLRITAYAQRLLDDMAELADGWPEHVLTLQRNWIGRAEGAHVAFTVDGREEPVTVFTTRPDTLFGVTFLAVAPETALAAQLCTPEHRAALDLYRTEISGRSTIERAAGKSGVFLGAYATNPVNGERVPVYAADYVLAGGGTGAVMGVPAHDQRDLEFVEVHDLPVRVVVDAGQERQPGAGGPAVAADGVHVNSDFLDGLRVAEATDRVVGWLTDQGTGQATVSFRLRDWLISRQRYWGTPIPIIHCGQCGEVPVPDDQLPVTLPDLRGADLAPRGVSPLAAATDWVTVTCPTCGGEATRDTDTMDTFVDSSWYFLRFSSPHEADALVGKTQAARWCPIDQYVGEATYATSHLLYARFITKVLHDLGMVEFSEPFTRLLCQGQVTYGGKRMSKSRGNMVQLSEQIAEYGVDAVRLTMVFAGPPAEDIDWADVSPAGSRRFLSRALRLAGEVTSDPGTDPAAGDVALRRATHRTLDEVTGMLEGHRFNVVVARLMTLVATARKAVDAGGAADPAVREAAEVAAIVLSLFAPYTAEEMWHRLGHAPTVARAGWPVVDASLAEQRQVECVVQVAGRKRAVLSVRPSISEDELSRKALADPAVVRALDGRDVARLVVRPPNVVNVVPVG